MKKFIALTSLLALTLVVLPADASKPGNPGFSLPEEASEVAPNVYSLGQAFDVQSHQVVEGYAIVHKKGNAKGGNGGGKPDKNSGPTCYGYLASGAKWKTNEPWVVNTANQDGLSQGFVFDTLANGIQKWEEAAEFDILGDGSTTSSVLVADEISTDGLNEVYFGDLGDGGTIGVTIIWGIFGGPPFNRQLVEWDQVYNTFYDWSASGEADKMDFDNIGTHELGHSVGMGDIYNSGCGDVTMYGYADYGETNKQTLEAADIAGISALY